MDDAIKHLIDFATAEQKNKIEENEFTLFGRSVGKQLINISPNYSAMAMGQIQQVLVVVLINFLLLYIIIIHSVQILSDFTVMTLQEKQQNQQQIKQPQQIQQIQMIPASSVSSIGSYSSSSNSLPNYIRASTPSSSKSLFSTSTSSLISDAMTNANIIDDDEENDNFNIEL